MVLKRLPNMNFFCPVYVGTTLVVIALVLALLMFAIYVILTCVWLICGGILSCITGSKSNLLLLDELRQIRTGKDVIY